MSKSIAVIFLILGSSTSLAQQPPRSVPATIERHLAKYEQVCRKFTGRAAERRPGWIRTLELNDDQWPDYVVEIGGRYSCRDRPAAFLNGHNGHDIAIFAGGKGHVRLAFEKSAYDLRIEKRGRHSRVVLLTAALGCGQPKAPKRPFSNWLFCWRPLHWSVAQGKFEFGPLTEARFLSRAD